MREGRLRLSGRNRRGGLDSQYRTGGSVDLGEWLPLLKTIGLPMVCANLTAWSLGRARACAGALAEWYEAQGGPVHWHGKPYAPVYRKARAAMGLRRHEVLAIGDSFTTDVAGARGAGIDVLLVNTGIHQNDLDADLMAGVDRLSAEKGVRPTFAADRLQF